jgi:integrase
MGHAFNLAIKEWEWVRDNPVRRVSKEKVDNQVERWLTREEEEALVSRSPEWLGQIIVFAINTGLRESEILDLKWPQVDLSRRTIAILKQKNKAKDTLPVNGRAMALLKERARVRDGRTDHVFYNGNAARINARNLLRAFYSAVGKSKVAKARFHDLRHTFTTRLVQAGVDIYTVQKLGRWKTITMVMRYAHHCPESLRSGVEVLDKIEEKFITNLAQPNKKGAAPVMQPLVITGSGAWI